MGVFLLLCLLFCFVCFLGFVVFVFNLVCGFTFFFFFNSFSLAFFLLPEICMNSFQDKLLGIADQ